VFNDNNEFAIIIAKQVWLMGTIKE